MQNKGKIFQNPSQKRGRSNSRLSSKGNRSIRTFDDAYSLIMSRAQDGQEKKIKSLDPYSKLTPPEESVNRRIFLWSNERQNYTLKEFQQISNVLTGAEIRDVFEALRPYASKVLDGKKCIACKNKIS